jgi:hypothetical protein
MMTLPKEEETGIRTWQLPAVPPAFPALDRSGENLISRHFAGLALPGPGLTAAHPFALHPAGPPQPGAF